MIASTAATVAQPEVRLERHPTVVDDFIRNFLIRAGMRRSLEAFNTEWYEMKAQGLLPAAAGGDEMAVPDVYAQNEELQVRLSRQDPASAVLSRPTSPSPRLCRR